MAVNAVKSAQLPAAQRLQDETKKIDNVTLTLRAGMRVFARWARTWNVDLKSGRRPFPLLSPMYHPKTWAM